MPIFVPILAALLFAPGVLASSIATITAWNGAGLVGHQVSDVIACFAFYAVLAVTAAKLFGAARAAWSKSLLLQYTGGAIAVLCAGVTGGASVPYYLKHTTHTPSVFVDLLGWAPETARVFERAYFAGSAEATALVGLILGAYFWKIGHGGMRKIDLVRGVEGSARL